MNSKERGKTFSMSGMTMASDQDLKLYTVAEVQKILRCSRTQIYKIVHASGFPTLRIGSKILIEKSALEKWVKNNLGKTIFI